MTSDAPRELRDVLNVAWRRRLMVAVVTIVVGGAAIGTSLLRTPVYRAEAELLVRPAQGEQILLDRDTGNAADAARALRNEVELLMSDIVRDAVAARYDGPLDVDDVDASAGNEADLITIALATTDPEAGAALLDLYAGTYLETRRARQTDELLAAGTEVRAQLESVQARVNEIRQPLDDLDARIAQGDDETGALAVQRERLADELAPQLDALRAEESYFRQQLDQLQLTAQLASSGGPQLLTSGEPPEEPVSPNPPRDGALGFVLGALLGVGLAFLRDHLDDSVGSKEALERITDLPTLALVPTFESPGDIAALDQASAAAEAYRSLRTSVKFLSLDRPRTVIQVVSAVPSEGKTETATNLAVAMARSGERVVVVGADLRRPRTHEVAGVRLAPGLTDVLAGSTPIVDAVVPVDHVHGLYVLPAGFPPPNPSELLGTTAMGQVVMQLSEVFDVVVLDGAPVVPVTDSLVLSRVVDATILVAAKGTTSSRSLTRAVEMLRQVGAPLVGTVLNRVPPGDAYVGTEYRYTPAPAPEQLSRRVLRRRSKVGA